MVNQDFILTSSQSSETEDVLDKLIQIWAEEWAKQHGSKLAWVGYTEIEITKCLGKKAQKSHIIPNKHKLSIECGAIENRHLKQDIDEKKNWKKENHHVKNTQQKYDNGTDVEQEFNYTRSIERTVQIRTAITWTVGFNIGFTLGFNIAGLAKAEATPQFKIERNKMSENLEAEKETVTINEKIRCPAKKSVCVEAVIEEEWMTAEFERKALLSGYVTIACKKKVKHPQNVQEEKHKKWAIPVSEVFQNLKQHSDDEQINQKVRDKIHEHLGHFDFSKKDTVSFKLKGIIEPHRGIRCRAALAQSSYGPIRYFPNHIHEKLLECYQEELKIKRLFYDTLLPIKKHYIHLSIVDQSVYQERVDKLNEQQEKEQAIDKFEEESIHLYGHTDQTKSITEIFQEDPEKIKKILVTGTPGIGKTVFSSYVPHLWAKGECATQYSWVLLIKLRNLLQEEKYPPRKDRDYRIIDILNHECFAKDILRLESELTEAELDELEREINEQMRAEKVLFILDGYDEIVEYLPKHLEKVLQDFLNTPSILLTSRSYNLQALEEKFKFKKDRHFEITGFTPQNTEQYINDFFDNLDPPKLDRARDLLTFLDKNPRAQEACRIPINSELVCSTWDEQPFRSHKTISMSRLYHEVIISLCLRVKEKGGENITDWTDDDVFPVFQSELAFLDFFAYQTLVQRKIFSGIKESREYIATNGNLLPEAARSLVSRQKRLGFIKPNNPSGKYDGKSDYYFNHLTFRDFFAARYLVNCLQQHLNSKHIPKYSYKHHWHPPVEFPSIDVDEFIRNNKFEVSFELVIGYIVGQLAQMNDLTALQHLLELVIGKPQDILGFHTTLLLVRCLDEIQELVYKLPEEFVEKIFSSVQGWLHLSLNSSVFDPKGSNNPLWQRLKVSQWLLQTKEMRNLFADINEKNSNMLAECLRTLNYPFLNLPVTFFEKLSSQGQYTRDQFVNSFGQWSAINADLFYEILNLLKSTTNEEVSIFSSQVLTIASNLFLDNLFQRCEKQSLTAENFDQIILKTSFLNDLISNLISLVKDKDFTKNKCSCIHQALEKIFVHMLELRVALLAREISVRETLENIWNTLDKSPFKPFFEYFNHLAEDSSEIKRSVACTFLKEIFKEIFQGMIKQTQLFGQVSVQLTATIIEENYQTIFNSPLFTFVQKHFKQLLTKDTAKVRATACQAWSEILYVVLNINGYLCLSMQQPNSARKLDKAAKAFVSITSKIVSNQEDPFLFTELSQLFSDKNASNEERIAACHVLRSVADTNCISTTCGLWLFIKRLGSLNEATKKKFEQLIAEILQIATDNPVLKNTLKNMQEQLEDTGNSEVIRIAIVKVLEQVIKSYLNDLTFQSLNSQYNFKQEETFLFKRYPFKDYFNSNDLVKNMFISSGSISDTILNLPIFKSLLENLTKKGLTGDPCEGVQVAACNAIANILKITGLSNMPVKSFIKILRKRLKHERSKNMRVVICDSLTEILSSTDLNILINLFGSHLKSISKPLQSYLRDDDLRVNIAARKALVEILRVIFHKAVQSAKFDMDLDPYKSSFDAFFQWVKQNQNNESINLRIMICKAIGRIFELPMESEEHSLVIFDTPQFMSALETLKFFAEDSSIGEIVKESLHSLLSFFTPIRLIFVSIPEIEKQAKKSELQNLRKVLQILISFSDVSSEVCMVATSISHMILTKFKDLFDDNDDQKAIFSEYIAKLIKNQQHTENSVKLLSFLILLEMAPQSADVQMLVNMTAKISGNRREEMLLLNMKLSLLEMYPNPYDFGLVNQLAILDSTLGIQPELLSFLLEKISSAAIFKHMLNLKDPIARQNYLSVLISRLIVYGKSVFIKDNRLYYYENRRYEKIPLGPHLSEKELLADFVQVFRNLTDQDLSKFNYKIFAPLQKLPESGITTSTDNSTSKKMEQLEAENRSLKEMIQSLQIKLGQQPEVQTTASPDMQSQQLKTDSTNQKSQKATSTYGQLSGSLSSTPTQPEVKKIEGGQDPEQEKKYLPKSDEGQKVSAELPETPKSDSNDDPNEKPDDSQRLLEFDI